jgi:hypothetical protein
MNIMNMCIICIYIYVYNTYIIYKYIYIYIYIYIRYGCCHLEAYGPPPGPSHAEGV